jgi:hypothetical protein
MYSLGKSEDQDPGYEVGLSIFKQLASFDRGKGLCGNKIIYDLVAVIVDSYRKTVNSFSQMCPDSKKGSVAI